MADLIGRQVRPDRVILFGSYARGEATEDSDVDLLVVVDESTPSTLRERSLGIRRLLTRAFAVPVDVVVRSAGAVRQWKDVPYSVVGEAMKDGRVLYEREPVQS